MVVYQASCSSWSGVLKETAVPAISEALPVLPKIDHKTDAIPVVIPAPSNAEPKLIWSGSLR